MQVIFSISPGILSGSVCTEVRPNKQGALLIEACTLEVTHYRTWVSSVCVNFTLHKVSLCTVRCEAVPALI